MYVTGSDAWNSQKQMSEGRIGGKSRSEGAEGLPDTAGGGNQWRGLFHAPKVTFPFPAKGEPFAYFRLAPIFGS
jgi:hypothetical protein